MPRKITITLTEREARATLHALKHCLADVLETWSTDGTLAPAKTERDAIRRNDAGESAAKKINVELNDKHPKECLCGNCP